MGGGSVWCVVVEEADGGCILRDGCEFNGRGWVGFAVPPSASRDADDCPLRFLILHPLAT